MVGYLIKIKKLHKSTKYIVHKNMKYMSNLKLRVYRPRGDI